MNPEPGRRLILGFALFAALFFLALVAFRPFLALGVLFASHMLILSQRWWQTASGGAGS